MTPVELIGLSRKKQLEDILLQTRKFLLCFNILLTTQVSLETTEINHDSRKSLALRENKEDDDNLNSDDPQVKDQVNQTSQFQWTY